MVERTVRVPSETWQRYGGGPDRPGSVATAWRRSLAVAPCSAEALALSLAADCSVAAVRDLRQAVATMPRGRSPPGRSPPDLCQIWDAHPNRAALDHVRELRQAVATGHSAVRLELSASTSAEYDNLDKRSMRTYDAAEAEDAFSSSRKPLLRAEEYA